MSARTIQEILADADNATELDGLIALWNEIAENKYKYSLNELSLACKRISELSLKANGNDVDKGHFYFVLTEMNKQP